VLSGVSSASKRSMAARRGIAYRVFKATGYNIVLGVVRRSIAVGGRDLEPS
jgi:hypothetical protein